MGTYHNINDVTPLGEDDIVDLGEIQLRVYHVPGHSKDHIAILDEKNMNIFVGDAIGYKIWNDYTAPPFLPPFWDEKAYLMLERKPLSAHRSKASCS